MALKRKGILARPGTYRYGDREEIKTAEELKRAAERQPIIALTLGHPAGGVPKASDFIGTVNQKWNEAQQRVDADYWFYDEIPDEVKNKIVNGWPTPISAGFTVDRVEDGAQKGIFYTHVAVLRDSDDPKCPLGQCGINVRMESNLTEDNYRYEQATDPDVPPEQAKPPKTEPFDPVGLGIVIGELKAEVAQLRKQIEESKQNQPVPQKQEEQEVVEEAEEEITTPEPPRPKTVIPQGAAKKKEGPDEDGFYRVIVG